MGKKSKDLVTSIWLKSLDYIKLRDFEKLQDSLDLGLVYLSKYTLNGYSDKDELEHVKMEVWKERFWCAIERYVWSRTGI